MRQTEELSRLEQSLDHIREAPADGGTIELIARRPAEDEREVLVEARLDLHEGLVGDSWRARGSDRTAAMYSPMATAKLNGLNSDAYLRTIKFF